MLSLYGLFQNNSRSVQAAILGGVAYAMAFERIVYVGTHLVRMVAQSLNEISNQFQIGATVEG